MTALVGIPKSAPDANSGQPTPIVDPQPQRTRSGTDDSTDVVDDKEDTDSTDVTDATDATEATEDLEGDETRGDRNKPRVLRLEDVRQTKQVGETPDEVAPDTTRGTRPRAKRRRSPDTSPHPSPDAAPDVTIDVTPDTSPDPSPDAALVTPPDAPSRPDDPPSPATVRLARTPPPVPRSPLTPVRGTRRRPDPRTTTAADEPERNAVTPVVERLGGARIPAYRHSVPRTEFTPTSSSDQTKQTSNDLRDPRLTCCMIALAAVEVLTGTRPLAQLARWVSPSVLDGLAQRVALTNSATRIDPRIAGSARTAAVSPPRPNVRRVRATRIGEGVVESAVAIGHAGRVRAVAIRLEAVRGRWRAESMVVG